MHRYNAMPAPAHPLFSIFRCSHTCTLGDREFTSDFYMIGFKKLRAGIIRYGRTRFDHDTGSMMFVKPRQIMEFKDLEHEEDGFVIFIHEDYLNGHPLHSLIEKYSYFDYETNEALHLSPREEQLVWDIFEKIDGEYRDNPDEYSREIILAHIDSLLKYAQRFYKRQFIGRKELSGKTVTKFNTVMNAYMADGMLTLKGLPSPAHIASQLNMSRRYLSDLLKQETGKTATELIHIHLIAEAKNRLMLDESNVSEIAYALGFESVPHFSRLFKKETGLSPLQHRKSKAVPVN